MRTFSPADSEYACRPVSSFQSMTEGSISAARRSKYATVSWETVVSSSIPASASSGVAQAPAATTARVASIVPLRCLERHAVLDRLKRENPHSGFDRNAAREGGERPVGPDDAAVELEHDLALELDAEAPPGFTCVQHLVLRRAGVERGP